MRNRMKPKSLITQISLVMLTGIVAVLALATQIYSDERQHSLNIASSHNTLKRVGSLIEVLNKTPASLHNEIIKASQGAGFFLSLDEKPLLNRDQNRELSARLKRMLATDLYADVRISSALIESPYKQGRHNMMKRHREPGLQLSGSISVSQSHWLNFNSSIDDEVIPLPLTTLLLIALLTLFILIFMAWVVKRALRPIDSLAIVARKVGCERDFNPIAVTGPSEILPTIIAFNQMQSDLAAFIDDRTKMLAAISHDLRTPITSLRLRLEFIEQGEDQRQMLVTVNQMQEMLKATLNFARDESIKEAKQEIEISSLLETICDDYRDKGAQINLSTMQKIVVRLWPTAFRRMLENIINNSLAYGQDKQGNVNININCFAENKQLIVEISDNGQGIAESQFSEVIKPFVRLDKARDTSDASVGLGLAICLSIIQAHGGELSLSNKPQGGLLTKLSLPM